MQKTIFINWKEKSRPLWILKYDGEMEGKEKVLDF